MAAAGRSGSRALAVLVLLGCASVVAGVALSMSRDAKLDGARERASAMAGLLATRVEGLRQDLRKRAEEGASISELQAAVQVVDADGGGDPLLVAARRQPLRSGGAFTLLIGRRLDAAALGTLLGDP